MTRALTDEERRLLSHVLMFGSDGYPIAKVRGGWIIDHPAAHFPAVFRTKRAATEQFERYLDVLREALRAERAAGVAS